MSASVVLLRVSKYNLYFHVHTSSYVKIDVSEIQCYDFILCTVSAIPVVDC